MSIQLKNVNKKYESKEIFTDFNLSIKEGEMIAIVGNSGKGKTTLLNIIGGLEKIDAGEVTINGMKEPYKNKQNRKKLYREHIGFLFQNYALIDNLTVKENISIAMKYIKKSIRNETCDKALEKVGLLDKKNTKVFKLSGGEQQRVALARLMVKPNQIILADEPTGALDEDNKKEVIRILKEFHKMGKSVVIVTHDQVVAQACERIVEL